MKKRKLFQPICFFCFMCKYYKDKIHYCSALGKYVNIDDKNLVFVEGYTHSSVEGYEELRVGKFRTWMFDTRNEMKYWLKNIVKIRESDKKTWFEKDPLTGDVLIQSLYERKKYGVTTARAKARKKLEEEKSPTTEELSA